MSNFAKFSRGFGAFYRDTRENLFALSESQLEGGSTKLDIIEKEIEIFKKKNGGRPPDGQDLIDIYNHADEAGRLDAAINIPLIYVSNRFVFDGIFNFRGAKTLIEAAEGNATKGVAKGFTWNLAERTFKENAEGLLKSGWKTITRPKALVGSFMKYSQANFAEGLQELGQEFTSGAIKNYYVGTYADPSLGGKDYMNSSMYSSFGQNIWSKQGVDTFLSGFLMGGATHGAGKLMMNTVLGSQKLFLQSRFAPKTWQERYQNYEKQKAAAKEIVRNSMNEIMSDPEKFFSRRDEMISNQKRANQDMAQADLNNDAQGFHDAKDDKTFDHLFTVLQAGSMSQLRNALRDMKSLSDEELKQAYNTTDGAKAREKLDEYMNRADQIERAYDMVNKKFGNPFNPTKFTKKKPSKELSFATQYLNDKITAGEFLEKTGVDVQGLSDDEITQLAEQNADQILNNQSEVADYIKEFIAYKAFEDAKKAAVASTFGYERAVERMVNVFEDIISDGPLSKINALDFTVLQSEKGMSDEIKLLREEVESLEAGGPEQQAQAKLKREKLNALQEYLDALRAHKSTKGAPIVNENGQVELAFDENSLGPLRQAYENYLKSVANLNEDYVFGSKVEDSFNKLLDYYDLDASSRRYNNAVNALANPETLLRYADTINSTLTDLYMDRFNIMDKRVNDYMSILELNMLMRVLGEMGVKINPADVEDLLTKGIIPNTYFDLRRNSLITQSDARYPQIIEMVKNFASLQENKTVEQAEVAQGETPAEETTPTETTPAEEVVEEKEVIPTNLPAELETRLREAYDEYVKFNPDASLTFEEYVSTSSKAQRIKEEYEEEQKKPATPAETVEVKAPEIEVITEPEVIPTEEAPISTDSEQQKREEEIRKRGLDRLFPVEIDETTPEGKQLAREKAEQNEKIRQLDAELAALEGTPEVTPVVEEVVTPPIIESPIGRDKVANILSGINSLRDMPNLALNDKSEVTLELTTMAANLEIDAIELNDMIQARREQLKKQLTTADLQKGDFVTFNDRRKGWVSSVAKTGSIQMKMVGSEKGVYEIMDIKDIAKNVTMIEKDKKVSTEPVEAPTVTEEDKVEIEASKTDTRQEFSNNIAKVQESTNQAKENSKDGVNNNLTDLLNNLGCKTKGE